MSLVEQKDLTVLPKKVKTDNEIIEVHQNWLKNLQKQPCRFVDHMLKMSNMKMVI